MTEYLVTTSNVSPQSTLNKPQNLAHAATRHSTQYLIPHANFPQNQLQPPQTHPQAGHSSHLTATIQLPSNYPCRRQSFLYRGTDSENEQDLDPQALLFGLGKDGILLKKRDSAGSLASASGKHRSSLAIEGYILFTSS